MLTWREARRFADTGKLPGATMGEIRATVRGYVERLDVAIANGGLAIDD